jgi:hypothetical protein
LKSYRHVPYNSLRMPSKQQGMLWNVMECHGGRRILSLY